MPDADNPVFATFRGEFRHSMDAKHRITIPAQWRRGETDQFVSVPEPQNQFLLIMPPPAFEKIHSLATSRPDITPEDERKFIRYLYSQGRDCAADRQGRILLPEQHCKQVGLGADVVLVGDHERFEIWNMERWERTLKEDMAVVQSVGRKLGI